MTFFEVLVEGSSDVAVLREILSRRFLLQENLDFRIHPHQGRGSLPRDWLAPADPRRRGLLDQLPAKLRGLSGIDRSVCVLVVIDVDSDPCVDLLGQLRAMLERLPKRPAQVLFRLAIEETESWFIADINALKRAYPKVDTRKLTKIAPDSIVGAAESLARALGKDPEVLTGADKFAWASAIAPHMQLIDPPSPSLAGLLRALSRQIDASGVRP
jgi:Domain of unknown function (DUF4276)